MDMELILDQEFAKFAKLRRRLIESDPDIDETTLLDTLQGATDLHEAIGQIVRSALDDEAIAASLKSRIGDMKSRLERFDARSARKRQLALEAMEEAGIEKVLEPDLTISKRINQPGLEIKNEADIPEQFWVPQPAKLDRRGLLDALNAGTRIPGAQLGNSRISLTVRTK